MTGFSRTYAQTATELLKLSSYKTVVVHVLKEHDPIATINIYHGVHGGKVDP